jgi:hypothetical protein
MQRAENAAIRRLGALTASRSVDKAMFKALLADVHAARDRTIAAYDAWTRGVGRFADSSNSNAGAIVEQSEGREILAGSTTLGEFRE